MEAAQTLERNDGHRFAPLAVATDLTSRNPPSEPTSTIGSGAVSVNGTRPGPGLGEVDRLFI